MLHFVMRNKSGQLLMSSPSSVSIYLPNGAKDQYKRPLQDSKSENGTDRYPIASVVCRQSDTHNVCSVASMPTIGSQKKIYFWLRLGRMFTALEQKKEKKLLHIMDT